MIMVSPLPAGDTLFNTAARGILFAVHDPHLQPQTTDRALADLLQISIGAAKVVLALLEGIELPAYAEQAGISINTVRFHLKRAFAATDTHSQSGLVRVALAAINAFENRAADESGSG
jgi:DNA-binding NarL/FixJ family response regulator